MEQFLRFRRQVTGGDRNDVICLLAVGVVIVGEIFRYHVGAVIDDSDLLAEIHGQKVRFFLVEGIVAVFP